VSERGVEKKAAEGSVLENMEDREDK